MQTIPEKNKVKGNKGYSIKFVAMLYLLPHSYGPRPCGQNATKHSFFLFLLLFFIYLSGLDLFRLSNFPKILMMDILNNWILGTLSNNYVK